MDYQKMKQELDDQGYTIVRGLLTGDEVDYYVGRMEALSGITRSGMTRGGDEWKGSGRGSGGSSWTLPDGVVKSRLAEIEHERRTGYAWYVDAPAALLAKDYPAWKAKHAMEAPR